MKMHGDWIHSPDHHLEMPEPLEAQSDDLSILVPAPEMDKNTDYSSSDRYSINNILVHTITAVTNGTYPFL